MNDNTQSNEASIEWVESELAEDEAVVWVECPDPRKLAESYIGLALFGLFGLVLEAVFLFEHRHALNAIDLLIVPGSIVPALMTLSPWLGFRAARMTIYAVTDRRIMSFRRFRRDIDSIWQPDLVRGLQFRANSDGSGEVKFEVFVSALQPGNGSDQITFGGLKNPQAAERAILNLLMQSNPQAAHAGMPDTCQFDAVACSILKGELADDETVLWFGLPSKARRALKEMPGVIVGVAFVSLCCYLNHLQKSVHVLFYIAIVPLAVLGVICVMWPFYVYFRKSVSVYAITNRRALIIEGFKSSRIRSFFPREIEDVKSTRAAFGRSDIYFSDSYVSAAQTKGKPIRIGFLGVTDTEAAKGILQDLAFTDRAVRVSQSKNKNSRL